MIILLHGVILMAFIPGMYLWSFLNSVLDIRVEI